MKKEIKRSSKAWRERYLLERMRQGKFSSVAEAFQNGWYEIQVKVVGSRLALTDANATGAAPILSIFSKATKVKTTLLNNPIIDKLSGEDGKKKAVLDGSIVGDVSFTSSHTTKKASFFGGASSIVFSESFSSYYDIGIEST